jgi:hypothetical protein
MRCLRHRVLHRLLVSGVVLVWIGSSRMQSLLGSGAMLERAAPSAIPPMMLNLDCSEWVLNDMGRPSGPRIMRAVHQERNRRSRLSIADRFLWARRHPSSLFRPTL